MSTIFQPETLHGCARTAVDLPVEAALDAVTAALKEAYPDRIEQAPRRWFLNNAGGAMGEVTLLYASLREYLIFFGTPIGTEGHSGRYGADVWDFVFSGEVWCYQEGETERHVYAAGDMAFLGGGKAKGYRIPDQAWMLEYARGNIPFMLPFGILDTLTSTLDFRTLARTFAAYTTAVMRGWRTR